MLVVRWNLFNGGIDKARVGEAQARSLEAREISANTRRIIERETRVSWNAIEAARRRVPLLRRQVAEARATRSAYAQQFDAGTRRLLDLLNVQSELFLAEASLRTEHFVQVYNSYRLQAAIGQLVASLGLEAPPEATTPPAPTLVDGWREQWQTRDQGPGLTYHRDGWATSVERGPTK
jgi:adhesin transport system outer membrane protein